MSSPRIEHVNVTVADPDRAAKVMEAVFGWTVRWSGPAMSGGRSVHIGSQDDYVALYNDPRETYAEQGVIAGRWLNHIGVEVDDLDATEARVVAAGLKPINHGDYHPGRRFYFLDLDGIEYEVVSYRAR